MKAVHAFSEPQARAALPKRPADFHKRKAMVFVLAGSTQYFGAALLSAKAAYRGGAGTVRLAVPEVLRRAVQSALPEAIVLGYPGPAATLKQRSLVLQAAADCHSVVVGPGLGRASGTQALVRALWARLKQPSVFDADALFALAKLSAAKRGLKLTGAARVLTPHDGEMQQLLGGQGPLAADRESLARSFARAQGVTLLLKGPQTLCAAADGRMARNTSGHRVLATAGTGDVLAGLLAALLAQGAEPFEAAALAAWVHGKAAQAWAQVNGDRGLLASDLIERIPAVLGRLA
jgi:ADP-dependent NAD(P)H-hydrate dehydratase / NAD(P)H-hydrate epimerase